MKRKYFLALMFIAFLGILSFKKAEKVNIWMIGDSTMANKKAEAYPETGWGMVLQEFFGVDARVHNHAVNGRSSKSFLSEGRWKIVLDSIQPGDYVIIQFGHNDQKKDTARFTDPFTTYKEIIKKYITETRNKGAFPIVCSSIVRRHFDPEGKLKDTHGNYITAAREIALETNTPFVDLEADSRKLVSGLGPEKSKALYLFCKPGEFSNRPKGVQDSTHLNVAGAHKIAQMFVEELKAQKIPLSRFLK